MDGWKRILSFWDDGLEGAKRVVSGEDTTSTTTTFFRRSKIVSDSLRGGCQRLGTIQKSCQVGCIMHTEGRHLLKRWWFEAFLCIFDFTRNPGEMILFDEYCLQVGWNHQLVLHMIWVILLMVQESGYITSWYGEYLIFSQQFVDNRWCTQKDGRFGDTPPQKLSRIPHFWGDDFPNFPFGGRIMLLVVSRRISLIFQFPNNIW